MLFGRLVMKRSGKAERSQGGNVLKQALRLGRSNRLGHFELDLSRGTTLLPEYSAAALHLLRWAARYISYGTT